VEIASDQAYQFIVHHFFETLIVVAVVRAAVMALIEPADTDSKLYRWVYGFLTHLPFMGKVLRRKEG
jgi:hypothetical protein